MTRDDLARQLKVLAEGVFATERWRLGYGEVEDVRSVLMDASRALSEIPPELKRNDIQIVSEWDLTRTQERLNELCRLGYQLHTVTEGNGNKTVFIMVREVNNDR